MKECSKCKEVKEFSEFLSHNHNKDGLRGTCKSCQSIYNKNKKRSKEGKLKSIYNSQIVTSKRRCDNPPTYTKEDFVNRFIDDKDYLLLHSKWVKSGYDKMLAPSFDRLDDYKPYSFDNLNKWMTWQENNIKGYLDTKEGRLNKRSKAVIGTNINTNEKIHFHSCMEAGRNGFDNSSIGKCCLGKENTHKGYTWKYKNEVKNS